MNGLRVTVETIDHAGKRKGNPEVYVWLPLELASKNNPMQIVGQVLAGAVAAAVTRKDAPANG
jgi:hypothetical protein